MVQFNNDCVWLMLTNNFANLAPAMRRRFNIIPFYSYRRLDAEQANARSEAEELKRLRDDSSQIMQLIYLRQVQFECLVYVGAMRDVPLDGWNEMVKLFKATLRRHHPTLAANLPMETIISDAREYLRMFVIKHAVYATFAHPRAPYRDPSSFKLEQFHFTELMLTPSMQAMMLALSMIEERVFPSNEKLILRAASELVAIRLSIDNRANVLNPGTALSQWEKSPAEYIASVKNIEPPPPPVRSGVAPPWRSMAAMKDRLEGLVQNKENMTVDELPVMVGVTDGEIGRKLEYVTVFEKSAVCIPKFCTDVVEEFCKILNSREDGKMEHEHMEKSLGEILVRVVRGTRVGGKAGLDHTAAVIEEAGMIGMNKVYRLCVSKSLLDMLKDDKLSMRTLLAQTACRMVPPGIYPVAAAYTRETRLDNITQDGHLPQLPAVFKVPHHQLGCPAVAAAPKRMDELQAAAREEYEIANDRLQQLKTQPSSKEVDKEVAELKLQCMHASQRERFAWADPECVEKLGCTCVRRLTVSRESSYGMPNLEARCFVRSLGKDYLPAEAARVLNEGRAGSSSRSPPPDEVVGPIISYSEIGWLAHVKAVMGRPWEELSDEERATLEKAHPDASEHWVGDVEPGEYPTFLADNYIAELKARNRQLRREDRSVVATVVQEEEEIVDMDE